MFELQPLGVPDPAAGRVAELRRAVPAVRLLVDRVRQQAPDFTLTTKNAGSLGEIVRRLDGLPLGIELVAPLVATQTPGELLERLESQMPLLIGGSRSLPSRHQTLHETIDWSFRLLSTR